MARKPRQSKAAAPVKAASVVTPPSEPIDLAVAQADDIAKHAERIDSARAALIAAGDAAASAQGMLDAVQSDDHRAIAQRQVEAARAAVERAQVELDALIGIGENKTAEIPAGSHVSSEGQSDAAAPAPRSPDAGLEGEEAAVMDSAPTPDAVASASGTLSAHTPQSDGSRDGEASDAAGLTEDIPAYVPQPLSLADELAQRFANVEPFRPGVDFDVDGPPETIVIEVRGPSDGRWRIGRHFGRESQSIAVTAEQFGAIMDDPRLSWSFSENDRLGESS